MWTRGKLDTSYLRRDEGAAFKQWAATDFLDALCLKCYQQIQHVESKCIDLI